MLAIKVKTKNKKTVMCPFFYMVIYERKSCGKQIYVQWKKLFEEISVTHGESRQNSRRKHIFENKHLLHLTLF